MMTLIGGYGWIYCMYNQCMLALIGGYEWVPVYCTKKYGVLALVRVITGYIALTYAGMD